MKKRILSLLLVVAMLAGMIVLPVYATDTATQSSSSSVYDIEGNYIYEQTKDGSTFAANFEGQTGEVEAECPVCKETVTWTDWSATLNAMTKGTSGTQSNVAEHVYLASDVETDYLYQFMAAAEASATDRKTVCIFLNNKTFSSTARAIFVNNYVTMNVMGDGEVIGAYGTADKGWGSAIDGSGWLNLYGGTYKRTSSSKGSVVQFRSGTDASGQINIYEGTHLEGDAYDNGYPVLWVTANTKATMYGGSITGGVNTVATKPGGNVSVSAGKNQNAVFNLYGGTISGGTAPQGGNICVFDSGSSGADADLNIYGGTITDGTVYAALPTVTTRTVSVSVSGAPEISALDLTSGAVATISGLTDGASIGVTAAANAVFTSGCDAAQTYLDSGYVYSNINYADVYVSEGELAMTDQICPHCDAAYSDIEWIDWNTLEKTTLVASGATEQHATDETYQAGGFLVTAEDDVHYKLTADFTGASYGKPEGSDTAVYQNIIDLPTGKTAVFDLAGYTMTGGDNRRVFCIESGGVTLLDSVGGGFLQSAGLNTKNGAGVVLAEDGTVYTQYHGTVQRTAGSTRTAKNGGVIYGTRATINIFGGTVTNGSAGSDSVSAYGGNIYVSGGTLTIRNAVISEGISYGRGGNIYATGASVTIENSQIDGGTVTSGNGGGNIYATGGSVTIKNSQIDGGTVATGNGGNIYAVSNASVTIEDSQINGGTVTTGNGGNIYANGVSVTIKNSQIDGGTVATGSGGNIYATETAVTIEDSQINGGTVTSGSGGSIYLTTAGTSLTASGSSFIGGSCSGNGGTFYAYNNVDSIAFTNCRFEGGTCGNYGGIMFAQCKMSFEGCTGISGSADADGDLTYPTNGIYNGTGSLTVSIKDCDFEEVTIKSNATMSGKVNIANYWPMNTTTTANISALSTDSRITVYGKSGSTITAALADDAAAQAYLDAGTFTSGSELILEVQDAKIVQTEGPFWAYCHDCGKEVEWEVFAPVKEIVGTATYLYITPEVGTASHYYLTEDYAASVMVRVGYDIVDGTAGYAAGGDIHIELNGNTYDNSARAFYVYSGNHMHIQDTSADGTGKVIAEGQNGQTGGVIYVEGKKTSKDADTGETVVVAGAASLSVYGGTYQYELDTNRIVDGGAVLQIPAGVEVTLTNATFDASQYNNTAGSGGAIYINSNSDVKVTDCTVIGGTAKHGGAIRVNANADLVLAGSTVVRDGKVSEYGGNIYCLGGRITMSDTASVVNGSSDYRGGNLAFTYGEISEIRYTGGLTVKDKAEISGGIADCGGNVFMMGGATLTMTGGTVSGGTAYNDGVATTYGRGGNLYLSTGEHTISGGTISGGTSEADNLAKELGGGNLYLYSGGTLTVSGGTISGGESGTYGGNIYSIGALVLENGSISGGSAVNSGADIYIGDTGSISVSENIAGDLGMGFHDDKFDGTTAYGSKVLDSACTTLIATMTLDGVRGNVPMYAQDGALWVQDGGVAIEDLQGNMTYYADPAAAVSDFNSSTDAYLVVCGADEIAVTEGLCIDVNGCTVSLTGTDVSVSCFDSANEDYKSYGFVTLGEGVSLLNPLQTNVDGHDYFTVEGNGQYSFHIMDMEITSVSLKTKTGGLYYWAKYYCDEVLKSKVDTFGIVTQLNAMPVDFGTTTLYSQLNVSDFVVNKEIVGGTMDGIIGDEIEGTDLTNDDRGRMTIYAAPYVILTTGAEKIGTEEIGVSLRECCDLIDDMITEKLDADPNDADAADYINWMDNYLFTDEVDVAKGKAGWASLVPGWQGTFTNFFTATTTEETT